MNFTATSSLCSYEDRRRISYMGWKCECEIPLTVTNHGRYNEQALVTSCGGTNAYVRIRYSRCHSISLGCLGFKNILRRAKRVFFVLTHMRMFHQLTSHLLWLYWPDIAVNGIHGYIYLYQQDLSQSKQKPTRYHKKRLYRKYCSFTVISNEYVHHKIRHHNARLSNISWMPPKSRRLWWCTFLQRKTLRAQRRTFYRPWRYLGRCWRVIHRRWKWRRPVCSI